MNSLPVMRFKYLNFTENVWLNNSFATQLFGIFWTPIFTFYTYRTKSLVTLIIGYEFSLDIFDCVYNKCFQLLKLLYFAWTCYYILGDTNYCGMPQEFITKRVVKLIAKCRNFYYKWVGHYKMPQYQLQNT